MPHTVFKGLDDTALISVVRSTRNDACVCVCVCVCVCASGLALLVWAGNLFKATGAEVPRMLQVAMKRSKEVRQR
jgi:hypothetical protein